MISASITCVAMAVYFEARGEPELGQYAVAEVIVNRVADPSFPNTACAVVFEDRGPKSHDCQFSFTCDGKSDAMPEGAARDQAFRIAREVWWYDTNHARGATFFHADGLYPSWAQAFELVREIGKHNFYSP